MSSLYNYALEYNRGREDGRKEILNDIQKIVDDNEYPEYLEMIIIEYLEKENK